jgi:MFS family permease
VIGAGVALVVAFIAWQLRGGEPLVPLRLFLDRNFSLMNWTSLAMSFAMQGIFIPITIYTQSVLGMTPLQSGLTVAPMSIAAAFLAPFAGRLSDRFGGKYLLMAGLALFGLGAAVVTALSTTTATQSSFILPFILTGIGLGLVMAPMTTVAMRDIVPAMAGAASGVLNTTRQLGAVLGSAAVGAVLQNRLSVSFHDQAVAAAAQLPPAYQGRFIDGFSQAAKSGLQIGRGQTGASVPAGLPAQVAGQIQHLVHDVFVNGYVIAMRPTVGVAVVTLALASLSCVLIVNRRRTAVQPSTAEVAVA